MSKILYRSKFLNFKCRADKKASKNGETTAQIYIGKKKRYFSVISINVVNHNKMFSVKLFFSVKIEHSIKYSHN